jgi:hypothetical protein
MPIEVVGAAARDRDDLHTARGRCRRVEHPGLDQRTIRDSMPRVAVTLDAQTLLGMLVMGKTGLGVADVSVTCQTAIIGHRRCLGERERRIAEEVHANLAECLELVPGPLDRSVVHVAIHTGNARVWALSPGLNERRHLMARGAEAGFISGSCRPD